MRLSSGKRRSGILACHSPSEAEDTTENSPPPYPAFPEIADWRIFYTFPTIRVNYQPFSNSVKSYWDKTFEDILIAVGPKLESFKKIICCPWYSNIVNLNMGLT
jgi:hypothetical protein